MASGNQVPNNITEGTDSELHPRNKPEPRHSNHQGMPEHLADLSSQDRLRVLGDALAVRVRDYDSQYVGIIVDVLLQLPTSEVLGLLDHSDALERSAAAVQHQLGLPATTSIPAPRNVAPDPVGPHIPRSGAEQAPQGSMINRQPLALPNSCTPSSDAVRANLH